jgi:hypothetical protein
MEEHEVLFVDVSGSPLGRALLLSIVGILNPRTGVRLSLLVALALAIIKHGSVLVHSLAKLGEQWLAVDAVPLALGFGPNAICQDEATAMDHRFHVGLAWLA